MKHIYQTGLIFALMYGKNNINIYLRPLSWLYGAGVWCRNKLFDWKLLPTESFPVPVISVGNLTVGGTGKTPHVEYLISILKRKYKVAVLSRGYKRKTKGFVLAGNDASADTLGDEPYQIYRKHPSITVAVDENRRRGIKMLLELPGGMRPEVILLDDAFQHRYVKPSLSILLTKSSRMYYDDALLPAGRLRESKQGAARADTVIVTKTPEAFKPVDYRIVKDSMKLYPYQDVFFTSYDYKSLLPVFPESTEVKKEMLARLQKENTAFLLVAGIADPAPLISYLGGYTGELHTLIYADHHAFTPKDIDEIVRQFDKIKHTNKLIITTEKDAARLIDSSVIPARLKPFIFYQPIEVLFNRDEEESFKQKIYNHVDEFKRNSILA